MKHTPTQRLLLGQVHRHVGPVNQRLGIHSKIKDHDLGNG
jgi:hypothetical protein